MIVQLGDTFITIRCSCLFPSVLCHITSLLLRVCSPLSVGDRLCETAIEPGLFKLNIYH